MSERALLAAVDKTMSSLVYKAIEGGSLQWRCSRYAPFRARGLGEDVVLSRCALLRHGSSWRLACSNTYLGCSMGCFVVLLCRVHGKTDVVGLDHLPCY